MSQMLGQQSRSTNAFQISSFADDVSFASYAPPSDSSRQRQPSLPSALKMEGSVGVVNFPSSVASVELVTTTLNLEFETLLAAIAGTTNKDLLVQTVDSCSRVEEAIGHLVSDRSLAWRKPMRARLQTLLVDYRQEHEGADFSLESLLAFHEFCQLHPGLRMPFVTVTETGELYARWKRTANEVLSLRFFNCADVSYVLFRPDGDRVERLSGRESIEQSAAAVALPTLSWVQM